MKLVQQHGPQDCSLACIAMLAMGTVYRGAYRRAMAQNPGLVDGCSQGGMLRALAGAWSNENAECVLIRESGKKYGHWIVVVDGSAFDPEYVRSVPLHRYSRRSWLVLCRIVKAAGETRLIKPRRAALHD